MQDESEDRQEYYRYLNYEYWCDPLYTIEVEDKIKSAANQIKKIDSARSASLSDSDESAKILKK